MCLCADTPPRTELHLSSVRLHASGIHIGTSSARPRGHVNRGSSGGTVAGRRNIFQLIGLHGIQTWFDTRCQAESSWRQKCQQVRVSWPVPRKIDLRQIASAPQCLPLGAWYALCYLHEVVDDRLWIDSDLEQVPSMCMQLSRCVNLMLEQVGQAAHHLDGNIV